MRIQIQKLFMIIDSSVHIGFKIHITIEYEARTAKKDRRSGVFISIELNCENFVQENF